MDTLLAQSPDGTQIAYDITGSGPVIVLMHGGGHQRQRWHEVGYVQRLQGRFTVITIDARGHGESDKPTDAVAYTTTKLCQDILAVVDRCGVERFTIWGYSYGGNIGRYLAAESARVQKLIIIGIPLGLGAAGEFRNEIRAFQAHWLPILQAQRAGTLDLDSISEQDRGYLVQGNTPVFLAWLSALLDWRAIEPRDLKCPTLWLSGSNNEDTLVSMQQYAAEIQYSQVQTCVIEGLDHGQEFTEIDKVFPVMLAFTESIETERTNDAGEPA